MKKKIKKIIKPFVIKAIPNKIILWKGSGGGAKSVALTFDDGPNPQYTGPVLDILHAKGIQATFFLVGSKIKENTNLAMRIKEEGHEIGNHSYTHNNDIKAKLRDVGMEIDKTSRTIEELLGIKVNLFRPPFGMVNLDMIKQCMRRAITISMWSVDIRDHGVRSVKDLRKRIHAIGINSKDIVLMHDNNNFTVQILPEIINHLQDEEFEFVTVSELI